MIKETQQYKKRFGKSNTIYNTELFNLLVEAGRKAEYTDDDIFDIYSEYVENAIECEKIQMDDNEQPYPVVFGLLDRVEVIEYGEDAGIYIFDSGMVGDVQANGTGCIKPEA